MDEIKKEDIEKLAELGRIKLREKDLESLHRDIGSILAYVKQIQSITADQKEVPRGGILSQLFNKFREDRDPHERGAYSKEILSQAPQRQNDYFKVKKII